MNRYSRVFTTWFFALLVFFAAANLAGVIRPKGLLPFRTAGFPFTVAAWGTGIEEFFDWHLLVLNALIASGVAGLVAVALTRLRCGSASSRK